LYNLPALTLHESAPGHAFQIAIALEHKNQPEFRRFDYISAYGEGWALYCEKLGQEMGMYETPYERFGMLGYQIWRAARLVVDTGVHSKGWTREQALKYMHDTPLYPSMRSKPRWTVTSPGPGKPSPITWASSRSCVPAKRRRKRSERNSTSALSTTPYSSSARYRCPSSRPGSTASSPKVVKAL